MSKPPAIHLRQVGAQVNKLHEETETDLTTWRYKKGWLISHLKAVMARHNRDFNDKLHYSDAT